MREFNGYYSRVASREVFFVSAAKRKSQKTRVTRRETAFFAVSVHREACYCLRNRAFQRAVIVTFNGKEIWKR